LAPLALLLAPAPVMLAKPGPAISMNSEVIPTSPRGSIVKKLTLPRAAAVMVSSRARITSPALSEPNTSAIG